MKAWNERHPHILLFWWVAIWLVYGLSMLAHVTKGDWGWAAVAFIVVIWANSRCEYWYNKTGERK